MTAAIDPWEVLKLRKKFKNYKEPTVAEAMKTLKKVRDLNMDTKMLIATEFPRTVCWVAKNTENSEV